ncbi:hypothetical protein Q8A67_022457 [Cirrhinus molitorella]|uniref:Uncharacterized protein n=1 Tax=Cirrhinus molitorella TaxID=172907 RepID=A0AA88P449_9TELE|nr:hypothetical protein Q8A67_022457 [Cirrhinus molitorella]
MGSDHPRSRAPAHTQNNDDLLSSVRRSFFQRSAVQRFRIASPAPAQNALAFSIRIRLYSPQRTTFELMKISAAQ